MERLAVELRSDIAARRVFGVAVPLGVETVIGGRFRERIDGAVGLSPAIVNEEHDRTRPLGPIVWEPRAAALGLRSVFPAGALQDDVLGKIRRGEIAGLSIEFHAERERWEGDLRIIEAAVVTGAAVTTAPTYEQTTIEQRSQIWAARGGVPAIGSPSRAPATSRRLLLWL